MLRYSIAFPLLCNHFSRCVHPMCPEEVSPAAWGDDVGTWGGLGDLGDLGDLWGPGGTWGGLGGPMGAWGGLGGPGGTWGAWGGLGGPGCCVWMRLWRNQALLVARGRGWRMGT